MTLAARIGAGALAGAAATVVMDAVTEIFYTAHIREREARVSSVGAAAAVAMKMLDALGLAPTEDEGRKVGGILHWTIGIGSGALAGALAMPRRVDGPVAAALTAAGMLAFDEFGLSALGAVPSSARYPWQTNLRSVVGHAAYAITLAAGYALIAELVDTRRP